MTDQALARQAAPRPPIQAGGSVAALIPQNLDEAFRVANAIAASGLAPKGVDKPEQVLVAIMAGAELGFAPFQAMQSFAVINGKPNIWGDAIPALLWSKGFDLDEWFDNDDAPTKAFCKVTRPSGKTIERTFSLDDAKKAALLGKQGPWQTATKRMLQMRARAFAARDGASDVLRGMNVYEEAIDFTPIRDVTTAPQPTGMRARLEARNAGPAPGFDADHIARETSGDPTHDAETGEIIEAIVEPIDATADDGLPVRDDGAAEDFPGDAAASAPALKTGAELAAEQAPPKPLAERIAAWKLNCERATTTAKLGDLWARSSSLRNEIDAGDPDEVGTVKELQDWWQARFDAADAKERGQ